jgi:hypothetical protein
MAVDHQLANSVIVHQPGRDEAIVKAMQVVVIAVPSSQSTKYKERQLVGAIRIGHPAVLKLIIRRISQFVAIVERARKTATKIKSW